MPDLPEHHLSSCYLEISRADLAHNARAVCDYVNVPVIGVVKCDGYGVSGPEAAAAWVFYPDIMDVTNKTTDYDALVRSYETGLVQAQRDIASLLEWLG